MTTATTQPAPHHARSGDSASIYQYDATWSKRVQELPLGATHGGVVVDGDGFLYCSTDGARSIVVLDADGRLLRQFAAEWSGVHALQRVDQQGEAFLLATHLAARKVVLMTIDGRKMWEVGIPLESGFYQNGVTFQPTAAVLTHDGSLFVADGYGASVVHQFDPKRRYIKSFGGPEAGDGQLRSCHGMVVDERGPEPLLLICDRRNRRVVHYDLTGSFRGVVAGGLRRPCSIAMMDGRLAVAELEGRVTVMDWNHQVISVVGDNPDASQWAQYDVPPSQWSDGLCIAPHDVCFDAAGNLFVAEWNAFGRLSKFVVPAKSSQP